MVTFFLPLLAAYYSSIVDALVKKLGYKRGLNVRGVPFDFRKAPSTYLQSFKRFLPKKSMPIIKNNRRKERK